MGDEDDVVGMLFVANVRGVGVGFYGCFLQFLNLHLLGFGF